MAERAERVLTVPAGWFSVAPAMPGCCSRHGAPAARWVGLDLQSRPQSRHGRNASGNVLGLGARMSDIARNTKITELRQWPLCAACYRRHRALRIVAGVLFWGGLLALAGSIVARIIAGETVPGLLVPMVAGFLAMIAAGFVFGASGLARLIGAQTSQDGSTVLITNPHPRFAEDLDALRRRSG